MLKCEDAIMVTPSPFQIVLSTIAMLSHTPPTSFTNTVLI